MGQELALSNDSNDWTTDGKKASDLGKGECTRQSKHFRTFAANDRLTAERRLKKQVIVARHLVDGADKAEAVAGLDHDAGSRPELLHEPRAFVAEDLHPAHGHAALAYRLDVLGPHDRYALQAPRHCSKKRVLVRHSGGEKRDVPARRLRHHLHYHKGVDKHVDVRPDGEDDPTAVLDLFQLLGPSDRDFTQVYFGTGNPGNAQHLSKAYRVENIQDQKSDQSYFPDEDVPTQRESQVKSECRPQEHKGISLDHQIRKKKLGSFLVGILFGHRTVLEICLW
mmetsp:Transcript_33128/g.69328  ORF Transcript_33128/g.69328 Transcript_33128/m.69328 type:complete len:281 (-) Transcript_33128:85-927(-)